MVARAHLGPQPVIALRRFAGNTANGDELQVQADVARRHELPALLGELSPGAAAVYPTLGMAFASGEPASGAGLVAGLRDARGAIVAAGGSLTICEAPPAIRPAVDPWGPPPPSIDLMRALKERFDPDRRLAPGRFVGGI